MGSTPKAAPQNGVCDLQRSMPTCILVLSATTSGVMLGALPVQGNLQSLAPYYVDHMACLVAVSRPIHMAHRSHNTQARSCLLLKLC